MNSEKEKLLEETYHKFIQASLRDLPLDGIEEFVDKNIMGYGTTIDEKIFTVSTYRDLINRQREQGKDIEMKIDITSILQRTTAKGNSAFFVDEVLIKMIFNNETHQLFLRLSTVFEYREEKWIAVHFHSSLPGNVEGQSDTWHINEWKHKNAELEKLVEEKTADLVIKDRELEIESSLEKVRTVAMGMQKTDELINLAIILYKEIITLGFTDVRNAMINIFNDEKETFLNYDYSYDSISSVNEVGYNSHPSNKIFVEKMQKVDKAFMMTEFSGNDLDEWKQWRIGEGEMPDSKLDQAKSLYYYEYSIAKGAIGISTFKPITEEQLDVLQKFRNVFDLSYQHFNDLKKAEAQARDAQIEAALERVRSKTMAMHNSHDMGITVVTLFDEVLKLGIDNDIRCGIGILEGTERMETRSATSYPNGEVDLKMGMLDMTIHPLLVRIKKAWKSGGTRYTDQMTGKDVIRYYTALNNEPDYPFFVDLDTLPEIEYHNSFSFSEGILFAFSPNPMSNEAVKVFDRFARVFGQTYRRYRDLLKAEAQAREAQIEAALERVRAKAMAMHSSEDLALTIDNFFHELKNLNVKPIRCGVGIKDGNSRTVDVTVTSATEKGEDIKLTGKLTLGGHPILDKVYEALQLQAEYFPVLRGEEISEYYQAMNPDIEFPYFSDDDVQYGYYFHYKEGGVFAWTEKELLEEEINIFRRFKSVLSLTYRRYMDLIDAEVQAKEAKIEVALERVRAKAMAMHKSDDLTSAVSTVFSELDRLGFRTIRCGIGIFNDQSKTVDVWTTASNDKSDSVHLSGDEVLEGHPLLEGIFEAWQNQKDYSYLLQGKDLLNYYRVAADSNLPVSAPDVKSETTIQYYHCIMFPAGGLFAFRESEFSTEAKNLMRRFADVFQLTFTRHLDLRQAEAQNKIIRADNERKTQELEEARQLQLSMLPKDLPNLPNLDIAVYMQTATEVGGDYYDFHVGADGTLTAVVGDATGHGMKAGTVVTITKSLFNSLASNENMLDSFEKISAVIKEMKFRQLAMCLILMKIKENRLSMSSAAMPPVLIYRAKEKLIEELLLKGMPLGTMKKFPYKKIESQLNSGDRILVYSDGLPELANDKSEMYGYDRIKEEFLSVGEKDPREIVEHLKSSASDWVNSKDPDDDVTFVVLKMK